MPLDADGNRGAMLAVLPAAVHPSPASLDCLTHEYGLRDELNTAWAVRLRALGQERRPMLMLEDPGGEPLDRLLGAPIETRRFLNLAISIASALAKLHQQGLIHKDIKRSHILVNCTDEQIRLTGFGIASSLPSERQAPGPPESIAGNQSKTRLLPNCRASRGVARHPR